ncbi:MAG: flagellar basal body P-ring formation chaperone FlgA [Desulfobacteraceae bacterium]
MKKAFFLSIWVLLLVTVFSAVPALTGENVDADDSGISIELNSTSELDTDRISLGQIARIQAPAFLAEEIGTMDVGYAPKPGEIQTLSNDRLVSKIYSSPLISRDTPVSGPDTVYVKRSSQRVAVDNVRKAFMEYAASETESEDFRLRNFSVRGFEEYPGGELAIEFDRGRKFEPGGRFSVRAGVHVNGNEVDTLMVKGWINVYQRLVCAKTTVKREAVIQAEDLELKKVDTSSMRGSYAGKVEDVAGKISRSRIREGDFIRMDRLENPPLVKRGEVVKLVASKGSLKIVTSGICKEDGSRDKSVRVENLGSGRTVRGIVKGRSRVQVVY